MGKQRDQPVEASQDIFRARLTEYVSVRDEMISAISNQHLVLTFGTASIVGVFVGGILTWEQPANPAVFFSVPPLSAWILAMWLGEVVRMLRAVIFCREQEELLNSSMGIEDASDLAIRWESWRDADRGRTITWTYVSVVVALLVSYTAGGVCGLVAANWGTLPTVAVAFGLFLGALASIGGVARAYARWGYPPSRAGMPSSVGRWVGWLVGD